MYLVKTPWLLKKFYPQNLIWNKSRDKKIIYLTFDDGPIPIVTPFVLEILKKFNAKATFFCIGDNIAKHEDIFFQLKADGHAIGNHTYNHLNGWKSDNEIYLHNILKCQELTQTNLFRPPYGRIKKSQIKNLESKIKNQKIIMWDVLSGDFDTQLSSEKCLKNVCKHATNGSIVVFHDSLKAFDRLKYTLPKALEFWQSKGYEFHLIH
ncbi:polysaccharide deacetylase family protein [Pedobacter aquae]|uniref:Polysaccharide deacetylase family protein n=1 Tax=Pedobacter aquae TaxID=2605747 RepID=A0A5C0VGY1_9SPHI|nr:polysaccharide deacetylase family protein [Pedobacter aquae]QEK50234.1 polysaccharide deacetylase family protein [Pedobacter aquae]